LTSSRHTLEECLFPTCYCRFLLITLPASVAELSNPFLSESATFLGCSWVLTHGDAKSRLLLDPRLGVRYQIDFNHNIKLVDPMNDMQLFQLRPQYLEKLSSTLCTQVNQIVILNNVQSTGCDNSTYWRVSGTDIVCIWSTTYRRILAHHKVVNWSSG
jgi:hypothetical protein